MHLVTPDFGIIFWQTVTLFFVVIILGKFAWKPIIQVLRQREEKIQASLESAEKAQELLKELKIEQSKLIDHTNKEREEIIKRAMDTKQSILEAASIEAKQLAERLLYEAKQGIELDKRLAFDSLKQETALLAVHMAEKLLGQELQHTSKQEELLRRLVKEAKLP